MSTTTKNWYHSPEMLLESNYGKPVDMWAIGCIIAEMLTGTPLFPGTSTLDSISMIMSFSNQHKGIFAKHSKSENYLKYINDREKFSPCAKAILYNYSREPALKDLTMGYIKLLLLLLLYYYYYYYYY
jgi:serine/threonine protein kinase